MELVLVGAPGCGSRIVGKILAERHGAQFIDLTGTPDRIADRVSGLHASRGPLGDLALHRVIAADHVVADPSVRAQLYRGRHVVWLDVPTDQLVERLRTARREYGWISGDLRRFVAKHMETHLPYYFTGYHVDASGSISATVGEIEPVLSIPVPDGTLVLRADLHGGLLELGTGILGQSLAYAMQRLGVRQFVIITSDRARAWVERVIKSVQPASDVAITIERLPDGEPSKLLSEQETLFRRLARVRSRRLDPIVAIGDDVLLEAASFTASTWLRGVPLITVPVTTLGLIDTAIGGKGGIDLPGFGRNLLGRIHQPVATILDTALVADEAPAHRHAALSEVVKYGLIADTGLLAIVEDGLGTSAPFSRPDRPEFLEMVERCVLVKRRLVALDERDTEGIRVALNLGHTFSHALEAATGHHIYHGDAVSYGLRVALEIGVAIGVTPAPKAARAVRLLDMLRLGVEPLKVPMSDVRGYIDADKKRGGGRTRWVLVGPDAVVTRDDVPNEVVQAAIGSALSGRRHVAPMS